jgi:hypothetical protein
VALTSVEDMESIVGQRFPGGTYTVAHWENMLLHDVVEMDASPEGYVHPIGLFHVPLAACGLTFAEIFELCHAESDEAVRAGEYTWEIFEPLREGRTYDVGGEFTAVERKHGRRGAFDKVTFRLDVTDRERGSIAATVTNSWLFLRSDT